jgi:ketosteroid isomerase-like protein
MKQKIVTMIAIQLLAVLLLLSQTPAEEAEHLMDLDRDFDKATAQRGAEGWASYFAPNGSMLGDTSMPVTGPAEIRKRMEASFKTPGFSLRWQPIRGEMMIPGALGYTVGKWDRRWADKNGKRMLLRGTYTSVWRKQPDGSWKIILDTGDADGQPEEQK